MVDEKTVLSIIRDFVVLPESENNSCLLEYAKLNNDFSNYKGERVVYLFAGPSGSGKTTLIANFYKRGVFGKPNGIMVPFINRHFTKVNGSKIVLNDVSDEISHKRKLLKKGKSFVMETASLNDEYLEFLREIKNSGYKICMYYVTKRDPSENALCAEIRRRQGGHPLDSHKNGIDGMYLVNGVSLRKAVSICDSVYVIDNRTKTAENSESKPIVLVKKDQKSGIVYMMHPNNDELQREYHKIIKPKTKKRIKVIPHPFKMRTFRGPKVYTQKCKIREPITKIPEGYVKLPTGHLYNKETGDMILCCKPTDKKPKK